MSWINCLVDDEYEIFDQYPFYIRKKKNKKIIKEGLMNNDYVRVYLNGDLYYKHKLVAMHFIENDSPLIKTEVDHINHDRTDYHLSNLRWVSPKENSRNKSSYNNVECEFIDYELTPDDLVEVRDYGKHRFEDYYYSPDNNRFYFDTGVNMRVLHINFAKNGCANVCVRSTENKCVNIYFTKFKRIYGFD